MRKPKVSPEEQYRLIMECRQSGLSDQQWCRNNDINPGTFYNWVSRLRKNSDYDIPAPLNAPSHLPVKQEVVQINIQEKSVLEPVPNIIDATPSKMIAESPSMEICVNGSTIRITNSVAPELLCQTLKILKGFSC